MFLTSGTQHVNNIRKYPEKLDKMNSSSHEKLNKTCYNLGPFGLPYFNYVIYLFTLNKLNFEPDMDANELR